MIEKIIEKSAQNKFIVFLVVLFLSAWGVWALRSTPLDAIPDLSDVQVIVYTTWMGRNPSIVEDQMIGRHCFHDAGCAEGQVCQGLFGLRILVCLHYF